MSIRNFAVVSILSLAVGAFVVPYVAFAGAAATLKALDPDNDGTVSLDEAQAAGAKKFETLDADHDGTVDAKEAGLSKKWFKTADPDKDGTIDKTEYSAAVESAFKAADPDGDGTLDAKELKTPAGHKLAKLVD